MAQGPGRTSRPTAQSSFPRGLWASRGAGLSRGGGNTKSCPRLGWAGPLAQALSVCSPGREGPCVPATGALAQRLGDPRPKDLGCALSTPLPLATESRDITMAPGGLHLAGTPGPLRPLCGLGLGRCSLPGTSTHMTTWARPQEGRRQVGPSLWLLSSRETTRKPGLRQGQATGLRPLPAPSHGHPCEALETPPWGPGTREVQGGLPPRGS